MLSPASQVRTQISTSALRRLKYESETKAHLPWYLSRERLIESRISRNTTIRQSRQDLAGKPAIEHGPECVQLSKTVSITDPKIPVRQRVRRNLGKDTQHIVLVKGIEHVHVKLQRESLAQLDRVR